MLFGFTIVGPIVMLFGFTIVGPINYVIWLYSSRSYPLCYLALL